ncbi:hypothetical protein AB1N83_012509 [Pleurotus pulmonarius]
MIRAPCTSSWIMPKSSGTKAPSAAASRVAFMDADNRELVHAPGIIQDRKRAQDGDISTYIDTRSVGLHEDIFLPWSNECRLVSNLPSD